MVVTEPTIAMPSPSHPPLPHVATLVNSTFDHFEEITGSGFLHYLLEPVGKS